jgi:hypothetical protein
VKRILTRGAALICAIDGPELANADALIIGGAKAGCASRR